MPTAVAYADLLADAGVERGLIGPREVERLWERHLLNSAAVAAAVPDGVGVLDVGSGAGLPGIPLAIVRPDLRVTLVEPLLRRATFLSEVCEALGLDRVDVQRARAEDLPRGAADAVVARAVAPLPRLLGWTLPLLRPGGRLVAMKGQGAQAELDAAAAALTRLGARSWDARDLLLPGDLAATRAVVVVAGETRRRR
ncbi:MAG: 16S rRNA (guanine(527)-N(7))-methyltransferase RsmG [Jiangellales bacterium]